MDHFSAFFQSFNVGDHPNMQPSAAEKGKKKKHSSSFSNGSGGGAHLGRDDTDMRVPPNGNINAGYAVEAPWFWGQGETPRPGNPHGNGAPWFMHGGCYMTMTPPTPPVPPVPPIHPNFTRGPGAGPWNCGRVEMTMTQDVTGGVNYSGKPAGPSNGSINLEPGSGSNYYWGKGEIKVPPNANGNINIGLGAGGVNSGKNSASVNHLYGTISI
ncbi:hypothetical protein SLA2020_108190 [Shorea laevis]